MPPSSTVPPSGTLTVVETVIVWKDGSCTVVPVLEDSSFESDFSFLPLLSSSVVLLELVLDLAPSNVKVSTLPICVK